MQRLWAGDLPSFYKINDNKDWNFLESQLFLLVLIFLEVAAKNIMINYGSSSLLLVQ